VLGANALFEYLGRIADHRCASRNILRDHCASTDHRTRANRDTWENRRIGADRGALHYKGPLHDIIRIARARVTIVCERGVRPNADVVFQCDAIPELYAALDRDAVSDYDLVFDEAVRADIASAADDRAR